MVNHGTGDIKVLKFRTIELSKNDFKWNYSAYSPHRYLKDNEGFGKRNYKDIDDMACGINKVINPNESICIIDGKPVTEIEIDDQIFQCSTLDDGEMLELTKKIILLRAENKLEQTVN